MQRKTRLKSGAPPQRRTPIKPRRSKPRRRAGACRAYLDWLTTQACRITGKRTGEAYLMPQYGSVGFAYVAVDPAHVRTKRLGGDLNNAISLAHHLHEEFHKKGRHTWCRTYGLTWDGLLGLARQQTAEFLAAFPDAGEDTP